jgi:hypothetical protein
MKKGFGNYNGLDSAHESWLQPLIQLELEALYKDGKSGNWTSPHSKGAMVFNAEIAYE